MDSFAAGLAGHGRLVAKATVTQLGLEKMAESCLPGVRCRQEEGAPFAESRLVAVN